MNASVVVIGAGPAGLGAALALGRAGIATLVCERARFPVDKACGEGLLPNAVAKLRHFGIDAAALAASGRPLAGIRYTSLAGRIAQTSIARGTGFGVRRAALSTLLLARVRSLACVEVLSGVAADVRLDADARPEVWLGTERLRPNLVIGADGLSSRVRRRVGLATRFGQPRRFGVRQHFELEPWTEHVEVYFARGVEAYVTPLPDGVNVAFLWEPEASGITAGTALLEALLERFPTLRRALGGARAADAPRASGPFHQRVEPRSVAGALLVGDAAGYVDALTGEGVGLAFAQAEAIERTLPPRLRASALGRTLSALELEPVRRALADACAPNHRFTRFLLQLSRRPALFELAIALLAHDPELFGHFVAASGGARSAFCLPLESALRLPRSLFDVLRDARFETSPHALRNQT